MATQGHVRHQSACDGRPPNCLVEEVVVDCLSEHVTSSSVNINLVCSSGRNYTTKRSLSTHNGRGHSVLQSEPLLRNHQHRYRHNSAIRSASEVLRSHGGLQKTTTEPDGWRMRRRDVTRRSRHRGHRPVYHVISIQFVLSTRVAESAGDWPDEYHSAAARLYAMFDAIDDQFVAGQLDDHVTWSADHEVMRVMVEPIVDSLASARIIAVCEIGYQFNSTTLLCGTPTFVCCFSVFIAFIYLLN